MNALGIDDGLLRRLRDAGTTISWTDAPRPDRSSPPSVVRQARLREEEARVELHDRAGTVTVEATSGPVGALALLLEIDRRGPPSHLGSRNAGRGATFPDGSIFAAWGGPLPARDAEPTVRDLVELARYALV